MTNSQALELLELRPDQAGNVHQLQRAHARRKQAIQEQFDAATSAQSRATLLQRLQSIDLALVLLKADFDKPRSAAPPAAPLSPAAGPGKPHAPGARQRPEDWIAATPWNAIRNESSGEFRSPDESAASRPAAAAPGGRPAQPASPARKVAKPSHTAPAAKEATARTNVPPAPVTPARPAPPSRPAAPSSRPPAPPSRPLEPGPQARPALPPPSAQTPTPRPTAIGRTRTAVLMDLPESVLGSAPRVAPDVAAIAGGRDPEPLRPAAPVRPRLPRPEQPVLSPEVLAPAARRIQSSSARRTRNLVPLALLVLVVVGTAGAAGWAWREGAFDRLIDGAGPSLAERGDKGDKVTNREPIQAAPPTGNGGSGIERPDDNDSPEPVEDDAAVEAAMAQAEEIERLTAELGRLAEELGGPPGVDAEAQLAAARRAEAAGQRDESAEVLARLEDGLRAQVAAAGAAIAARQRLANAGAMPRQTPLAAAAADYVEDVADLARTNIAEGDFATAADDFEKALDARLRLSRESQELEPVRAEAAEHQQRIDDALEELDVTAAGPLSDALARARALEGEGFVVEAWLAGQRSVADLGAEYERISDDLGTVADQLERILSLRTRMHEDSGKLVEVENQVAEMVPQSEQTASWLDGPNMPDSKAQEGASALRAGKLEEAVDAYDAAAQQAAERLEAAMSVRELVSRHAEAAGRAREALAHVEAQMQAMAAKLSTLADRAPSPEAGVAWRALAEQIGIDLGHLQAISAATQDSLPADPDELASSARRSELESQAVAGVGPSALSLASAQQRLLILREVAAITGSSAVATEPPAAVSEARQALADLAGTEARLTEEEIASTVRAFEDAAQELVAAGNRLADPAADALAAALSDRQEGYRRQFGTVDLQEVWQPEGSTTYPAEMAEPVAAALASQADAEALRRELAGGGIDQIEAVLGHIRALDRAAASLQELRDAAEQADEQGRRRLHHSAAAGDSGEVGSLLALSVTAAPRDGEGATPLGLALAAGHDEVARMLLDSGGRPEGWIEAGRPIVFVAAASPASLRLLLEHGAPARDLHRGETALHALAWQANREQAPAERQLEAARILLDAGVDRGVRNRSGATAAELATSLGLRELADFLRTAPAKQRP